MGAQGRGSKEISIHAPHARSDSFFVRKRRRGEYFNPRSSCEERQVFISQPMRDKTFQSTLLMRGATGGAKKIVRNREISIHAPHARSDPVTSRRPAWLSYFNPRSSCEERPSQKRGRDRPRKFQSTLLMRGATRTGASSVTLIKRFQSTLLMRGATRRRVIGMPYWTFQSTLLMRGATRPCRSPRAMTGYFNPRSSCEERLRQGGTS